MKRGPAEWTTYTAVVAMLGVSLTLSASSRIGDHALSGVPFDLSWHTIDGGGGTSVGGNLMMSGTIGQWDAGLLSGEGWSLAGGFWSAVDAAPVVRCPADLTGSGEVGFDDLLLVLNAWGPCPGGCPADLDGDEEVALSDLLIVLSAWGPCS